MSFFPTGPVDLTDAVTKAQQSATHAQQHTTAQAQPAQVNIPQNANITVLRKDDEHVQQIKYIADLIDSASRLLINTCIAVLTWMSFQGGMFQHFSQTFTPQILATINKVADLAKEQSRFMVTT